MATPLLTWKMPELLDFAATANGNAVVTALASFITLRSVYWRVVTSGTDTGVNYCILAPNVGTALENMRVLVLSNPTAGFLSPDTSAANALWVGLYPDGGTFSTIHSTTPFGSVRSFGYWKLFPGISAHRFSIIESPEIIFLGIGNISSVIDGYGAIVGAIGEAMEGDTTYDADGGRIYGIATSGITSPIGNTVWSGLTGTFFKESNSNGGSHFGFFNPAGFSKIMQANRFVINYTDTWPSDESRPVSPCAFHRFNNGVYYRGGYGGMLRQMFCTSLLYNGKTLANSAGDVLGHLLGSWPLGQETVFFSNRRI